MKWLGKALKPIIVIHGDGSFIFFEKYIGILLI
jgi:hypothetical protein